MKKSPLYIKSGMGRAAEGSPIQFGLARPFIKPVVKYGKKGAKWLKKNWKELLGGELLFYGGEQMIKKGGRPDGKREYTPHVPGRDNIHGVGTPKI
tara:strand:+ start:127 stop:414 length:288 start_codon:yes stop_codon:yes gene_type:complete